MSVKYDASSIQILEGLEAVRKRPGMYIGSTDIRGLHQLVWELLDNAIDEAINGFGKRIQLTINEDNSLTVVDEGRGMPVGKHSSGASALEVIFTKLHAGGKFSAEAGYKTAGGLHGVGASVVNALSTKLDVIVCRDGKKYQMSFKDGGSKHSKLAVVGEARNSGSLVRFYPDPTIFTTLDFNYLTIAARLRENAFLLPNVTFELQDKRSGTGSRFVYANGLVDYIKYLVKKEEDLLFPPHAFSGEANSIKVDAVFVYTKNDNEDIYSFVNLVNTKDGGTHETGFKTAFTRVFNDYAKTNGLIKDKDSFSGDEVREGLTAVLSLSIPENLLQFEGQVKGKLGTPVAKNVVENLVYDQVFDFLNKHKDLAQTLIKKIQQTQAVKEAMRRAREEAKSGKKAKRQEKIISGKLAAANSKDVKKRELFLVEGDSAGGSAKQGRDANFQAILPLRGKVLNTLKASLRKVEANEELNTIINCLGAGVGNDFSIEDMQYCRVIIMTDADTDGAHIQTLILTFFYTYMRALIEEGYVFLAKPPLYKVKAGKDEQYCYDEEELSQFKAKHGKIEIQRYKGLGEMNADQLWETTMNPENRTLVKVDIEDLNLADRRINILMGEDAELRKEWIVDNIDFSLDDAFGEQL